MISKVVIKNFKSIRELEFTAKRVNVFVGEPNTGKSNLLEALALLSPGTLGHPRELLRCETLADLFFDQRREAGLSVQIGNWIVTLRFRNEVYEGVVFWQGTPPDTVPKGNFSMSHTGALQEISTWPAIPIRYYVFSPLVGFGNTQPGLLNPPFGDNLVAVLYTNEALRKRAGAVIRSRGFRLQLKPSENELWIAKDVEDDLYSYPWIGVSETLRRVIFLAAALETNHDATLLFDEPECNTFPFYTKYLAERIALDETNQFFITTHNPYLLGAVVSKAPAKDLAVFVTRMESFETKIKPLTEEGFSQLLGLGANAFFNLEKLLAA